jgi:hypothetical protein
VWGVSCVHIFLGISLLRRDWVPLLYDKIGTSSNLKGSTKVWAHISLWANPTSKVLGLAKYAKNDIFLTSQFLNDGRKSNREDSKKMTRECVESWDYEVPKNNVFFVWNIHTYNLFWKLKYWTFGFSLLMSNRQKQKIWYLDEKYFKKIITIPYQWISGFFGYESGFARNSIFLWIFNFKILSMPTQWPEPTHFLGWIGWVWPDRLNLPNSYIPVIFLILNMVGSSVRELKKIYYWWKSK